MLIITLEAFIKLVETSEKIGDFSNYLKGKYTQEKYEFITY